MVIEPNIKSAAIESFGKAFLLPINVLLGWIFTNNKRQRIFNRLSDTIVIKLKPRDLASENTRYERLDLSSSIKNLEMDSYF